MNGYGDILRVDLTTATVKREALPEKLAKKYIGGMGINDWLLWEHFLDVDPNIDPLRDQDVLIAGLGPLGATGFGLGSKMKFTFKSPVTGFFGDTTCGGTIGSQLRWAGIDHLVITGKAKKPVYLYIEDSKVEIRDATHLWGLGTHATFDKLRSEGISTEAGIACIGQAGENLVRFACIIATEERAAGRTGSGCVAGSKNLKAIVACGTHGLIVDNSNAVIAATEQIFKAIDADKAVYEFKKNGTLQVTDFYDAVGSNAYRNNQFSKVPDDKINLMKADSYTETIKLRDLSCSPGCTLGCDSSCQINGKTSKIAKQLAGPITGSPEYLTVASFGMGCDIPDFAAITYLHRLCNDYGIDIGEIGGILPFLMELWQRNIIKEEHMKEWFGESLSMDWGNFDTVLKVIRAIVFQKNELGKMCSHNVEKLAEALDKKLNVSTQSYKLCGKGGTAFPEDVRMFPSWALNLAVASRGADHLKGFTFMEKASQKDFAIEQFGSDDASVKYTTDMKAASVVLSETYVAAINSLGVCLIQPMFDPIHFPMRLFADALGAMTGISINSDELLLAGERACNLEKAFNIRIGLRREDDRLCERWMKEPVAVEYGKGMKAEDYLNELLDEYYVCHGWDKETSLPTRKKLKSLGLSDVADVLVKEVVLP
ncbi:MAG TPA: aldehyde ferredoxin oxidoreductase C-terminal domain-containing protein [Victivallales bacterium]|nr:aldehyde ferredoxin oxidoreductase C-terminal domain-containing protein [Victivallales bacterium]